MVGGSVAIVKLYETGYPLSVAAMLEMIFIPIKIVMPIVVTRLADNERPLLTVVKFIIPTYATSLI